MADTPQHPDQHTAAQPTADQTAANQPTAAQPTANQPAADRADANGPVVGQPVTDQPVAEQSVADQSVAEQSVASERLAEQPDADESVAGRPVTDQPVADQPVTERPVADQPVAKRPATDHPSTDRPVYVIGGGPGGLSVAYALRAQGLRAVVLEKSDRVGASWRRHYDRLRLHTTRRLSGLPGLPMPRRFGRWVARDDVVRYLEKYAEHHELEIVTGVEVSRVEPAPDGTGWLLRATGGRELTGAAVVVASGHNHTPRIPDWPGRDTYTGEFLHAGDYRNPAPYTGRDVLVIGVGNTGAEIAVDLAEGGASRVRLAVRTVPHIVRRSTAGWAAQFTSILVRRLPVRLVDRLARPMAKLSVPDLSEQGLPRPDTGLYSRVREGAIPVLDVGLIDAVRKGRVEIVAAVDGFEDEKVVLTDGTRVSPDVVVSATGYVRALEDLVGHLGVLDEHGKPVAQGRRTPAGAPGLYFTGFTNPISGNLREMAIDAQKIAKAIAGDRDGNRQVSRLPV